jgi:hypothetical protein
MMEARFDNNNRLVRYSVQKHTTLVEKWNQFGGIPSMSREYRLCRLWVDRSHSVYGALLLLSPY